MRRTSFLITVTLTLSGVPAAQKHPHVDTSVFRAFVTNEEQWDVALETYAAWAELPPSRRDPQSVARFFDRNAGWEIAAELWSSIARESELEVERSWSSRQLPRVLLQMGRLEEAIARSEQELVSAIGSEERARLLWTLGSALLWSGHEGSATITLEQAADLAPRLESDLCDHLFRIGAHERAYERFARSTPPKSKHCLNGFLAAATSYHERRVRCALALGRPVTAQEWLEPLVAMRKLTQVPTAASLLVRIGRRAGDLAGVAPKAREIAPDVGPSFVALAASADRGEWNVLFDAFSRGDETLGRWPSLHVQDHALALLLEAPDEARRIALARCEGTNDLWACIALASLGDASALPRIERGIGSATTTKEAAAWMYALAQLGSESAFRRLDTYRTGTDRLRREAARHVSTRVSRSKPPKPFSARALEWLHRRLETEG